MISQVAMPRRYQAGRLIVLYVHDDGIMTQRPQAALDTRT
jgi:hypothetical protein